MAITKLYILDSLMRFLESPDLKADFILLAQPAVTHILMTSFMTKLEHDKAVKLLGLWDQHGINKESIPNWLNLAKTPSENDYGFVLTNTISVRLPASEPKELFTTFVCDTVLECDIQPSKRYDKLFFLTCSNYSDIKLLEEKVKERFQHNFTMSNKDAPEHVCVVRYDSENFMIENTFSPLTGFGAYKKAELPPEININTDTHTFVVRKKRSPSPYRDEFRPFQSFKRSPSRSPRRSPPRNASPRGRSPLRSPSRGRSPPRNSLPRERSPIRSPSRGRSPPRGRFRSPLRNGSQRNLLRSPRDRSPPQYRRSPLNNNASFRSRSRSRSRGSNRRSSSRFRNRSPSR
ncbi:hypothetical protein EIN_390370 [Entamoeba invadens IP1]|uniref:Uncharacterized protein n=1 Tax=Entamoeba invadens IP1 TaxID=370355 RepID=A0A0A1U5B6_ENTIV|nr:hypothetical protein EIN_390370 [Entamoeba invadens IP1]ELP89422.1 hypothetical protein EIN_390370 [Entamoeba invadens IP1]|eukprot:XP_004256193.1 hypothetical protein EIN_390370 [Entamoeba invadens IP1]